MELRGVSDKRVTIGYSHDECKIMRDIIACGMEEWMKKYNAGEYDHNGKGYKIGGNKLLAGWSIFPRQRDIDEANQ